MMDSTWAYESLIKVFIALCWGKIKKFQNCWLWKQPGSESWSGIRIRMDLKCWIRIRTEINADLKHWFRADLMLLRVSVFSSRFCSWEGNCCCCCWWRGRPNSRMRSVMSSLNSVANAWRDFSARSSREENVDCRKPLINKRKYRRKKQSKI